MFHHWFGDLVTCESWSNLPLNESFATYGEYLWNEHKYGKNQADLHIDNDLKVYLGSSRIKVTNTFLAICLVYPEYPALCQTLDAEGLT